MIGPPTRLTPAGMKAATRLKQEAVLRQRVYGHPPPHKPALMGERVRIVGLTAQRTLNGSHGTVRGFETATNRFLVVLEGSGEGLPLRRANLQLAPPAPIETQYNVGTGQYALPAYGNSGRPRSCPAGSGGGPSYSTRRRLPQAGTDVAPPLAGALLVRPDEPLRFRAALRDGALPARTGGSEGKQMLRWVDSLNGQVVPVEQVDTARWLPIFVEGLRERESPAIAFIALQGAVEL